MITFDEYVARTFPKATLSQRATYRRVWDDAISYVIEAISPSDDVVTAVVDVSDNGLSVAELEQRLSTQTTAQLMSIARALGIAVAPDTSKAELIALILQR